MPANSARDPREDPRPGDVVQGENSFELYFVVGRTELNVRFVRAGQIDDKVLNVPLYEWVESSANDEVLYAAPE